MALVYRVPNGQALTKEQYDSNLRELEERPDGQIFPKTKGVGFKVDTDLPDWPWVDLIGDLQKGMSLPAGIEAGTVVYIGNIGQAEYAVGESQQYIFHIPHDWVPGHDAFIHVHWSHNNPNVTSGDVTFQLEVTAAKGFNTQAFPTPKLLNLTQSASTARYQHMIVEHPFCESAGGVGALLLNSEDMEPDTLILCQVLLNSNTMDNNAKPFVHSVDLHYQSTGLGTKEKSPNPTFWG